jgi:protein-disulfide isomerase/uncharacterized membrane protein
METDSERTQPTQLDFKPPRGWLRWTAVALALVGWWLSLDLVKLSFGLAARTPWLQAECGAGAEPSERFDCQSVLNSTWGSLPLSDRPGTPRIPIATFGMGYFAFVGLWYLFVGPPTRSRWARHLLITLVVCCGALESLHMVHVMGNVLHKWCWGCLAAHIINGGLLLVTVVAFPWRRDRPEVAPHPRGRLALSTLAACTFLFLLHPAVVLVLIANRSFARAVQEYNAVVDDPDYIVWNYRRQPVHPELAQVTTADAGNPQAPNTLVAFLDFRCSACKTAHETIGMLLTQYPDALRVSYRHFPQDGECNQSYRQSGHTGACRAARAAEAARVVGGAAGLLRMRDRLYHDSQELENAPLADWAAELGFEPSAFVQAMESAAVAQRVNADIELGQKLGLKKMPALFLNGRRLHYWSKPETWAALLVPERSQDADNPSEP